MPIPKPRIASRKRPSNSLRARWLRLREQSKIGKWIRGHTPFNPRQRLTSTEMAMLYDPTHEEARRAKWKKWLMKNRRNWAGKIGLRYAKSSRPYKPWSQPYELSLRFQRMYNDALDMIIQEKKTTRKEEKEQLEKKIEALELEMHLEVKRIAVHDAIQRCGIRDRKKKHAIWNNIHLLDLPSRGRGAVRTLEKILGKKMDLFEQIANGRAREGKSILRNMHHPMQLEEY